MGLREIVAGVVDLEYAHDALRGQPAQRHLEAARRELAQLLPIGKRARVSGSGRSLPVVPWIAVLDPDVTTTAQAGLYVVYLYSADLSRVYLSMNQGVTQHVKNAQKNYSGVAAQRIAIAELRSESVILRNALSTAALADLELAIDLAASGPLPRAYEAGNVGALVYDAHRLPDEALLQADLARMLALYDACVEIKAQIRASDPEMLKTAATNSAISPADRKPPIFRPKDSSEYQVAIAAHRQQKSRKHEALVAAFGSWVKGSGLVVATNCHPRDLTVDDEGHHWLVEAKTVRSNAEHAVREAIGQLVSYRHFLYREREERDPHLLALFTEPIGSAFVDLLISLGIESIWWEAGQWVGRAPDPDTSLLADVTTRLS